MSVSQKHTPKSVILSQTGNDIKLLNLKSKLKIHSWVYLCVTNLILIFDSFSIQVNLRKAANLLKVIFNKNINYPICCLFEPLFT